MKLIEANPKKVNDKINIEKGVKPSFSSLYDLIASNGLSTKEPKANLRKIYNKLELRREHGDSNLLFDWYYFTLEKILDHGGKPYRLGSGFTEAILKASISDKILNNIIKEIDFDVIDLPVFLKLENHMIRSFYVTLTGGKLVFICPLYSLNGIIRNEVFASKIELSNLESLKDSILKAEPSGLNIDLKIDSQEELEIVYFIIKVIVYIYNCENDLELVKPDVKHKGLSKKQNNYYELHPFLDIINVGFSFHGRDYSADKWRVSGHWRFQPHGENRKMVKLIWIDEHESGRNEKLLTTGKKENNPMGFNMKLIEANPKRSEKGTNKLRPIRELIKGGIADGMSDELFDSVELEKGIKVELEHTDNELIAKEIAKDHLREDEDYYKKLAKIHKNPTGFDDKYEEFDDNDIFTCEHQGHRIVAERREAFDSEIRVTEVSFDKTKKTFLVSVLSYDYKGKEKKGKVYEDFSLEDSKSFNKLVKMFLTKKQLDAFYKFVETSAKEKVAKNPTNTAVGEFYSNLYMVSYGKKINKDKKYEINMIFDNRDDHFEINIIQVPSYVTDTNKFSTDDLDKFNKLALKYFTQFELDRFHKEVQKYLNDEVTKGLKKNNPKKKSSTKKSSNDYSDELEPKIRPARLVKTSSGSIRAVIGWFNLKNGWEYFVLDSEQEGKDTILFCYVMGFENEFGYVSFNEVKPYLLGMAKNSKDLLDLMPPEDWEWVDNEIKEVDIYEYNR